MSAFSSDQLQAYIKIQVNYMHSYQAQYKNQFPSLPLASVTATNSPAAKML